MSTVSLPLGQVNVERLQRIKQIILEEPNRFFMEGYCIYTNKEGETKYVGIDDDDDDMPKWYKNPPCGTTACIAGWANILQNKEVGIEDSAFSTWDERRAADWLWEEKEVKYDLYHKLFHTESWPDKYRDCYENATSAVEAVQAAVDYIDYVCGIGV